MTDAGTRVEGDLFFKRHASAEVARKALRWNAEVRQAGVATPAARQGAESEVLVFDRIEVSGAPGLGDLLAVIAPLWRMPGLRLVRFDPFRRILPRLALAPPEVWRRVTALRAADNARAHAAAGAVHGDFHPGQVIRDQRGKLWLVDLDDLASGPAEADLGNLAAWMATQRPRDLAKASAEALAVVGRARPEADADLMAHYCAIALIRRALKLHERGKGWALAQLARGA